MKNTRTIGNGLVGLMLLSALALAGCSDSTEPDDDDHAEPEGVELVVGGQVVASYDGEDQSWTGEMEVNVGQTTPGITVRFVDHHGESIPLDDELYLEVEVTDESIAAFEQDTPGGFGGQLRGVTVGETGVTFKLMHGEVGSGHPDFVTMPVVTRVHGQV